jgi:hypothetical protein
LIDDARGKSSICSEDYCGVVGEVDEVEEFGDVGVFEGEGVESR